MNLNTEFNVGQVVYSKKDEKCFIIREIKISANGIYYSCSPHEESTYMYFSFTGDELYVKNNQDFNAGDYYYCLGSEGSIDRFCYENSSFDKSIINQGNAFFSMNDAVAEMKRREIHYRLWKLSNGYRFDENKDNYYLHVKEIESENEFPVFGIVIDPTRSKIANTIYFENADAAKNAVNVIGGDVLAKDYFDFI